MEDYIILGVGNISIIETSNALPPSANNIIEPGIYIGNIQNTPFSNSQIAYLIMFDGKPSDFSSSVHFAIQICIGVLTGGVYIRHKYSSEGTYSNWNSL